MSELWRNMRAILRGKPTCSWVRDRIQAYSLCEPTLSEAECEQITSHVESCESCSRELKEVDDALMALAERQFPDSELPPFDVERFVNKLLAGKFKPRFNLGGGVQSNIVAFPGELRPGIVRHSRRSRLRVATTLAAAAVLLLAVPALAYFGVLAVKHAASGKASTATHVDAPARIANVDDTIAEPSPIESAPQTDAPQPQAPSPLMGGIDEQLARFSNEGAVRAEAEVVFPHNEEDYAAWARRQYPHIMWLYDVLKQPENGLNWSGTWQELLINSGEILRFDWPSTLGEANCRPRLEVLVATAHVAGFDCKFASDAGFALPNLPWADETSLGTPLPKRLILVPSTPKIAPEDLEVDTLPDGYPALLGKNPPLAERTLVYLMTTFRFAGASVRERVPADTVVEWEGLMVRCEVLLRETQSTADTLSCTADTVKALQGLLEDRQEVLAALREYGIAQRLSHVREGE